LRGVGQIVEVGHLHGVADLHLAGACSLQEGFEVLDHSQGILLCNQDCHCSCHAIRRVETGLLATWP
jgi:hypothetical protein